MLDGPLMLQVNWPVVDKLAQKVNKFSTGGKIMAIGGLNLNNSPGEGYIHVRTQDRSTTIFNYSVTSLQVLTNLVCFSFVYPPLMRISSPVKPGLFGLHSYNPSITKLMKNKRTVFSSGGRNVHEQVVLAGYVNGQLGV